MTTDVEREYELLKRLLKGQHDALVSAGAIMHDRDLLIDELQKVRSAWQVQTAEWSDMQREFRTNIRDLKAERDEAQDKLMILNEIAFVRWPDDWPMGDEIARYIADLKAERDAALKLVDDTLEAVGAVKPGPHGDLRAVKPGRDV